ncbi:hypothetical protein D3H65_20110 [Paraflavitalea soli]|uniref:T9SS C-terminal target domain-containing protein n=1 Tax=Paraflavitalea soli TaxID=2315862 RepID=A0A3B7N169_9BACT|nr:hypothetical protein [Paraflavitalea soli]AXY76151.1 hypothetical protein D3H65_20110 [Paraflavitalea soli]
MQQTKTLLLALIIMGQLNSIAQKRWTGLAGDGQWLTPTNWSGNSIPTAIDDVILDNTFTSANYTVLLPPGNITVMVNSLTITPAADHTIEAILPLTNTAIPGLRLTNTGTALRINKGGIFRNASGALSGIPIDIAGALWIGNDGRYIHNTPRSHAAVVGNLSASPGTESGIFEFDIKGGGPLISFAGKTFGTLVLSATAAGGARTYNANGATPVIIRGNFLINDGVSFNLDLDDTIFIRGNYEQRGGIFNLGSGPNNTVVQIGKHLLQSKGIITENNNGLPILEMNGAGPQQLSMAGGIANSVALKINNAAGVVLQTPLSLPYQLELTAGQVNTSSTNLLTLQATCTVKVDSLSSTSFINGPLKKLGLMAQDQFLFPIGKGNTHRWLSLTQVTGNYTVEFFRANPKLMSSTYHANLHHISSIEHWTIVADLSPTPQTAVKLSFNDPNSGGVTDLATLRVARLSGNTWSDAGNTGCMGSPGSNGFVTSYALSSFGATEYFSLASTTGSFNPLLVNPRTRPATETGGILSGICAPSITSGATRLLLTTRKKAEAQLMIADIMGRVIKIIPVWLPKGSNSIPINATSFPAGIYTITVSAPEYAMQPTRFIKQ